MYPLAHRLRTALFVTYVVLLLGGAATSQWAFVVFLVGMPACMLAIDYGIDLVARAFKS